MGSSGLLSLLVLFILLVSVQGPGLTDWLFAKRCPRIKEECAFKERDVCTKDRQCQDNKKCCVFSCGKKCFDVKQGNIQSLRITTPSSPYPRLLPSWAGFVLLLLRNGLWQNCWTWKTCDLDSSLCQIWCVTIVMTLSYLVMFETQFQTLLDRIRSFLSPPKQMSGEGVGLKQIFFGYLVTCYFYNFLSLHLAIVALTYTNIVAASDTLSNLYFPALLYGVATSLTTHIQLCTKIPLLTAPERRVFPFCCILISCPSPWDVKRLSKILFSFI
uniref:Epididymal peptidase inhibitor n=1 Tax=Callithrix jacchus TaxID=9483 RepID=A0A8I3WN78_CALJA